jgi:hypothetical protein
MPPFRFSLLSAQSRADNQRFQAIGLHMNESVAHCPRILMCSANYCQALGDEADQVHCSAVKAHASRESSMVMRPSRGAVAVVRNPQRA